MGASRLHNIYHISRLRPFTGDATEGTAVADEVVPDSTDPSAGHRRGERFEVEHILAHHGRPGTKTHQYLIKWKGYIPQKSSWEKVDGVDAPAAVKKYTDELQQRIDYAKGVTTTLNEAAADAGGGSLTLDPEAWDDADAAVLSLMTEMDDRTLTFVAGLWAQRLAFSED